MERHKEGELSFLKGGEGEPLVLLHGIPGSAYAWEASGRLLADRYQVIIPDLLGFGRSDPPRGDYYISAQAVAIRELLVYLGVQSLYLGGHDFGAPVALTLMRLFPELGVRGMVLSATNVFTDTHIPLPLRAARLPYLSTVVYKAMAGNRLGMGIMYLAATKDKSEVPWEMFSRHLTPEGIDLTRRIFQRSLANLRANYRAIEDMLSTIRSPTLVLWGANDPFFAAQVGERAHRAIPGSRLEIYGDTGHFVPEERPSRVARDIMDFFGSIGP